MNERERLFHSFLMLSRSPAESNSTYVVDSLDAYLEKYFETMALRGRVEQLKPLRPWVGLTDEEIKEIIGPWGDTPIKGYTRKLFDQIEDKLKEKNTWAD
jgi:hypothetical protein